MGKNILYYTLMVPKTQVLCQSDLQNFKFCQFRPETFWMVEILKENKTVNHSLMILQFE